MKATTIELEIDGPANECLMFRPLERNIRGRLDFTRVKEPLAMIESTKWPKPIPSQRFGIEPDGTGYLLEPLHDEENAVLKEDHQAGQAAGTGPTGVREDRRCNVAVLDSAGRRIGHRQGDERDRAREDRGQAACQFCDGRSEALRR